MLRQGWQKKSVLCTLYNAVDMFLDNTCIETTVQSVINIRGALNEARYASTKENDICHEFEDATLLKVNWVTDCHQNIPLFTGKKGMKRK